MNRSVLEFTDNDLQTTKVFECSKCKDILHPPTRFVPETGNICIFCVNQATQEQSSNFISYPNNAVDSLLEKVQFPCPFQTRGCPNRFKYDEIRTHRNSCKFRTIKCVFLPTCEWEGQIEELLQHLSQNHPDNILKTQDNKFTIRNKKSEDKDVISILSLEKATFIFRFLIEHISNKIWYKIYDLENKTPKYNILVKHTGDDNRSFQTSCTIVQTMDGLDFDKAEATEVNITSLKELINPRIIYETVIEIKPKEIIEKLDESVLHLFECPVCKNYMKPPIYQCISGHSLCGTCKPKLERCPTCRANFANTRNYSMESLTNCVHYPCAYHEQGCSEVSSAGDIATHEVFCTYKPHCCFFQGCFFKGNYADFTHHLQNMHQALVFQGNTHYFTMAFYMDKYVGLKRYAMLCDNKIFQLSYKQSLDYTYWGVNVDSNVNSGGECNYLYEVCLNDTRKPDRKIIRTDACLKGVSDEEMFRKCLSLPNNIVMGFSNNNMLSFYIKLTKK